MRVASFSLAFLAAVCSSGLANAATVTALQGQVLVNAGQGYRLVDGSAQLGPGGTVVANPGAVAQVVYGGGCAISVQPGSVYLIAAQAPCQAGEPTPPAAAPPAQAQGGSSWGGGTTALIVGGAAVAGGAAAFLIVKSMSP